MNDAKPLPFAIAGLAPRRASTLARRICERLRRLIQPLLRPLISSTAKKREMQVMEIQNLGDKRFVALLRVGRRKYLIGGGSGTIALLADLRDSRAKVSRRAMENK